MADISGSEGGKAVGGDAERPPAGLPRRQPFDSGY